MVNLADTNLRRENLANKPIEIGTGLKDSELNNPNKIFDINQYKQLIKEDVQEFLSDIQQAIKTNNKDQAAKIFLSMREKIESQGKSAAYLSPSQEYCEQRKLQSESKSYNERLITDTHIQLVNFKHEIKKGFGKDEDVNKLITGIDEISKVLGYKCAIIDNKLLDQVEYNYSSAKMNEQSSGLRKNLNEEVDKIAQKLKEQGVKPAAADTTANTALPNQQHNSNKDKSL